MSTSRVETGTSGPDFTFDVLKNEEFLPRAPKPAQRDEDGCDLRHSPSSPMRAGTTASAKTPIETAREEHRAAVQQYEKLSLYASVAYKKSGVLNDLVLERGIPRLERDFRQSERAVESAAAKLKSLGESVDAPQKQKLRKSDLAGQFEHELREPDLKRAVDGIKAFTGTAGKVLKPIEEVAKLGAKIVTVVPKIYDFFANAERVSKVVSDMVRDGYLPQNALVKHLIR